MSRAMTSDARARLSGLLRRLSEVAGREATRAGPTTALTQLLDLPAEHDLEVLAGAATSHPQPFDSIGFLSCEGNGYALLAAVGVSAPPGSFDPWPGDALIDEAVATGRAALTAHPAGGPFPGGTRAACAVPMIARAGGLLGVAVFGSRKLDQLGPGEVLVARVVAERAARSLETDQMIARLARAQETVKRTTGFHDQVLAIVGHDLRNPLGAIVMSAALLQKKGGLSGWQAKTVDRVRSSALRMSRIIDDLLSYTRTRLGGGIPITRCPTDLGALACKIVDELRVAHPQALIDVSAEGDLAGEWDGDRLEQTISNLVSNALDHGVDGVPVVLALKAEGEEVLLRVTNRGEMPREVLEHAFEAFHRGPELTGRKASGLGLGLYIAREIVRRHGGEIAIQSEDGATLVAMRLPRRTARASAEQRGEAAW